MPLSVDVWYSLKTRITLTTLLIFLASLWALSFYASRVLQQDMQRQLAEQQFSTASMIAAPGLNAWFVVDSGRCGLCAVNDGKGKEREESYGWFLSGFTARIIATGFRSVSSP